MKRLLISKILYLSITTLNITLPITQENFKNLQTLSNPDPLASSLLLKPLQNYFSLPTNQIYIDPKDITIRATMGTQDIDNSCDHEVKLKDNTFIGTLIKGSYLKGDLILNFKEIKIMAAVELDSKIDIRTDVRVVAGIKVFGKCLQIAKKNVDVGVVSQGKVGVGIELIATDSRVFEDNGKWFLGFKFFVKIYGTVTKWNIDEISTQTRHCGIWILGFQVANVCSLIEQGIRDNFNKIIANVETIQIPAVIKKLEEKIKAKIGDEIKIPLSFSFNPEDINVFEI